MSNSSRMPQPVAITKRQLDQYNANEQTMDGVAFSGAATITGRHPNIYYICPKYWDVKNEIPLDPSKMILHRSGIKTMWLIIN